MPKSKKKESTAQSTEKNALWRIVANAHLYASCAIIVTGFVAVFLLLLESFRLSLILPISAVLVLGSFHIIFRYIEPVAQGTINESRLFNTISLVFVAVWGFMNLQLHAETVYLYRDPGLYNVTSKWLIENEDIVIPATNPFGSNEQLYATSNAGINQLKGENDDKSRLYTHGQRFLPALTAVTGRAKSDTAALKTNILIGSVALLSFYGFVRIFVRPRWALLAATILGLSLPMLYFSRDTYTEPVLLLCFFALLSALFYALRSNTRGQPLVWILAGFLAGSLTLIRVDAFLIIIGVVLSLAVISLFNKKPKEVAQQAVFFVAGAVPSALVGWLDLTQLGTAYYRFQKERVDPLIYLLFLSIVFAVVLNVVYRRKKIQKIISKMTTKGRLLGVCLIGLVALLGIIIARPLYINSQTEYEVQTIAGTESIVVQESKTAESITYDVGEPVYMWMVWYLGWLVVIFSVFGLTRMILRLCNKQELGYLPFLFSFGVVSLLYFISPSITPDHIWASRRFLPVIIPGMILLAVFFLDGIQFKRRIMNVGLYVIAAVLLPLQVINASYFFFDSKKDEGLYLQVTEFCRVLPENAAVLLIGELGLIGVQTIHSYCQVPTVRHVGHYEPTREEFVDIYENAIKNGYVPVVASLYQDRPLFVDNSEVRDLIEYEDEFIEKGFEQAPDEMVVGDKQMVIGLLQPDGRVKQYIDLNNQRIFFR